MNKAIIVPTKYQPSDSIIERIDQFLKECKPVEIEETVQLLLRYDQKSKAYYLSCLIKAELLVDKSDTEASIDDGEDDELYKLNRDVTDDEAAFIEMVSDAGNGRSFEDIVLEYDLSYKSERPLKVYGGQHRITAISKVLDKQKGSDVAHGVRVYFDLSREQKVEIARINNTSIAVPNDLLDRMQEQLLGTELRDWCQSIGLLQSGQDVAARKDPIIPTARIVRTLLVNYFRGMKSKDVTLHQPVICKSRGLDPDYVQVRKAINWQNDDLARMGREFARLHNVQRERVNRWKKGKNAESARKAISLTVVAAWGYAAGLFQNSSSDLDILYALPDSTSEPDDPLNAKALSAARLKGIDPDTYRGLGTRTGSTELGRMLEVFLVLATKATNKKITLDLANAAIKSYEAKRTSYEADKSLSKI